MGAKRAVLVGINYPGTKAELKGCHNDVARMRRCLVDRFGFDESGIRVLIDDGSAMKPTGANIRRELARLVGDARPGDLLFFHYSGHGTRLPAETGQDDDTGYDECIVPCDMNLITDQDFTELVQKVPSGCLFTIVSDSCHSGGLLDKTKEQIGHSTKQNQTQRRELEERPASDTSFREFLKDTVRDVFESKGIHLPHRSHSHRQGHGDDGGDEESRYINTADAHVKNRSLPLSTLIEILKEKTGKDDIDVGSIRLTLFNLFGDDASPKIKKFMKVMLNKLQQGQHGGIVGFMGALAQEFLKAKLDGKEEELDPAMKFFAWLLSKGRIQCKTNLIKKGIVHTSDCDVCHGAEETAAHVVFRCPAAREFWEAVGIHVDSNWEVQKLQEIRPPPHIPQAHFGTFLLLCCWHIWKRRNNTVFRDDRTTLAGALAACKTEANLWRVRLPRKDRQTADAWCSILTAAM